VGYVRSDVVDLDGLKGANKYGTWHSDVDHFVKGEAGWCHSPAANDRHQVTYLVLQGVYDEGVLVVIDGDDLAVELEDDQYFDPEADG
jgi:hypothetical protein